MALVKISPYFIMYVLAIQSSAQMLKFILYVPGKTLILIIAVLQYYPSNELMGTKKGISLCIEY